jgi:glucose-1-phosphatase
MEKSKSAIRNIIFDLGGVLIDLDLDRTVKAFSKLAIPVPADLAEAERRAVMYSGLETGTVSDDLFRAAIRELSPLSPSDEAIDAAWNAMLSGFPQNRVKTLRQLNKHYRVFLLSNSNAIHYRYYATRFKEDYAMEMDSLFEQAYYSFKLKMCKPHPEIFQIVLEQSGLLAEETLFIDDTADNVIAAAALGITVHQLLPGQDMGDLFRNGKLL